MADSLTLRAEKVVDFADLVGDDSPAGVFLDFEAEPLIACWRPRPDADQTLTRWARELGMPGDADLVVWHRQRGRWRSTTFEGPPRPFSHIQRTSTGWLCVEGRAHDPYHNAVLFDLDGRYVSDFHAGDAIRSVQVTSDGKVWVSNFDERDMDVSDLAEGLVCLDLVGRPSFRFSSVPPSVASGIFDCYALNVVSNNEAWAYYYTEFPLVKLVDFEVAGVWSNPCPAGPNSLAVSDQTVLFGPGYDDRQGLSLVTLADGSVRQVQLIDAAGKHLGPRRGRDYLGRGARMFVANKASLYLVDVASL